MTSKGQLVERLVRRNGKVRVRDLQERGLPVSYLSLLTNQGRLVRLARGIYAPADQELDSNHDWQLACLRIPQGVICLLSALVYHEIGTQAPRAVWMAIDPKARRPKVDYPPLRIVRFSGRALTHGVREARSGRGRVRVYDPAKTVADCFKYRRKLGLDVAVEALREGWRAKKFTLAQLDEAARVCRVHRVMQPYLEMLP
ncbi:MAG: type IV toxin-antitoxin system AbiEi family antitoxin domain-containing protein [Opitutaceae bacterium]|nr:type IV toxin-antitoxin system AbiEi family antitoxin domain-containing protein [Cephaloticoccus sp.]MCP5530388.1 type IV toxin-antitoxin system AbiEi family antitoxin domain-containing protein [Opitutaceae bacterium]